MKKTESAEELDLRLLMQLDHERRCEEELRLRQLGVPKLIWNPFVYQCSKCNEKIWSKYSGHYASCSCGNIAVDETFYYTRLIGERTASPLYLLDQTLPCNADQLWRRNLIKKGLGL